MIMTPISLNSAAPAVSTDLAELDLDLGDATLATEVLAAAPPELAEQVATADVTTLVKPPRRITSANYHGFDPLHA